ncbi:MULTISPECIES: Ppx/GppA phosphatase family protein [Eubacterium]|uniref:Ppx/GppA phosphatase family protein n=1 Tax=Eubacterium TaxID=1730 RepID=UPI0018A021EA|nr:MULTISPECIES: Ppx/GppA phosphatase family protein [Eubacterium]MBS6339574.1 Ppx/GppA family phosphatase [Eubacterium limosum]MDO5432001.1 Ppx/GppA phosphatase family protein [Eubacterium sp.]
MSESSVPKEPKINRAVIDIGTNSTRMLIFRKDKKGQLFRVNKSVRYTRMGQGVNKTKRLHPDAIKRNIEALEEYKNIAEDYEVKEMFIFGTSALRDAENSLEFIDLAAQKLGMKVEIISGEKEAEYGFIGVSQCFDEGLLIFDIGGGSTELIYGQGRNLIKMKSLDIGSVRSTEAFIENDPPKEEELNRLNQNAAEALERALVDYEAYKPYKLIGIGGTATTVSTIKQKLKIYDSEQVHQSVVTKTELESIIRNLSSKTIDERRQIVGLEAKRADIIIAGTSILDNILKVTGKDSFVVCDYDNLEGAAYSRFLANKK